MECSHRNRFTECVLAAIDSVFVAVFGRCRRKLGNAELKTAWRNASNQVSGYLVLPAAATVILLIAVVRFFAESGLTSKQTQQLQILGGVVWLIVAALLRRRFEKYLSIVPTLASTESHEERTLVRMFRAIAIGTFALACVVAVLMHKAGLDL